MRLGSIALSGDQDCVVVWWNDADARVAFGLTHEQRLDLVARVLARYPVGPGLFFDAKANLGRTREDGNALVLHVGYRHYVALVRPWALAPSPAAQATALLAVPTSQRLLVPICVASAGEAAAVTRELQSLAPSVRPRTFEGERGVSYVETAADRLALGHERTVVEDRVDAALVDRGGVGPPVVRRRPQDGWADDYFPDLARM